MQRTAELPGGAYFDGAQTLAPLDKMRPYEGNPRDPLDIDFEKSSDFRSLVHSIEKVGITNPLQVYWDKGGFDIIAGHRRLAAINEINKQRLEAWKAGGSKGKRPDVIEFLPASIQKAPTSEYERQVAMWNAEEAKADWPDSRKFNFFCITYDAAPPPLQSDIKELAKELGMRPSTVRTYLELRSVEELRKAMANPSNVPLPRAGRHKTLRAIARLTNDLVDKRPTVVRVVTHDLAPSDPRAKEVLVAKLLSKRQVYAANPRLGVGPGVALERSVPLIDLDHEAEVTDAELIAWLDDASVLKQEVIERRAAKQGGDGDGSGDMSIVDAVKAIKLRQRPGVLPADELQQYVDEVTLAADYLAEEARKARASLQAKIAQ